LGGKGNHPWGHQKGFSEQRGWEEVTSLLGQLLSDTCASTWKLCPKWCFRGGAKGHVPHFCAHLAPTLIWRFSSHAYIPGVNFSTQFLGAQFLNFQGPHIFGPHRRGPPLNRLFSKFVKE